MFRGFPSWLFAAFREFSCGYLQLLYKYRMKVVSIGVIVKRVEEEICQGAFAYSFLYPKNVSPWHEWLILGGAAGIFLHSSFPPFLGMRLLFCS